MNDFSLHKQTYKAEFHLLPKHDTGTGGTCAKEAAISL
jgi:hypothetical protein